MKPSLNIQKLPRKSLAQQVAEQMRAAIFDGRLRSGATLNQAALAREFGVSVIPLREALCQLEGEGLVRHESHRGVVVADMNAEDVEELIDICTTLEELAFERALPKVKDADVEEAGAALRALRTESDLIAFGELAWNFRRTLLRSMECPRLLTILETLNKNNRRYIAAFFNDPAARKWLFGQWTTLLACVRRKDRAGLAKNIARVRREGPRIARRLLPPRASAVRKTS